MSPAGSNGLSDYKTILLAHEHEYRLAHGPDRLEIVEEIMKEMVAQRKGTLGKATTKQLRQVKSTCSKCNPEISPTWT